MGDASTVLDVPSARHLLRRAGFGAPPADVESLVVRQLTRGQAADELLAFVPKAFKPGGRYNMEKAHASWVNYMVRTRSPLQEKLVLFWHDHFATSAVKVENVQTMAFQIRLLHAMCKGSFKDLVKAINRDPAMIVFLDTHLNHKELPNENYARELQELFTLGVYDFAGNATYTQQDVVQIARAFTGWTNHGFLDYDHDYNAEYAATRGPKRIYQATGGFGAAGAAFDAGGEGAREIDTVTDIIFQHTDSDGRNTVARRIARRLIEYFAHPIPDPISAADAAVVDQVVLASNFTDTWDIGALVRAIFVHDAFYETAAAAPFVASTKKSVKWPVDYVISTVRLLRMRTKGRGEYIDGGDYSTIREQLSGMGQVLLEPPSVFGWDWETGWISSATLLARYNFARNLTAARNGGSGSFRPERFSVRVGGNDVALVSLTDPDAIVTAVTDILGVTDQLSDVERAVLLDYLTDGGSTATIDLIDYDVRNRKLHGLFALVLQSPAYQLH